MNVRALESFVKSQQNSFKSLFQKKQSTSSTISEDSQPDSPKLIPQLSPFANSVVARCSKVLKISTHELQHRFDIELPESVKQLFTYARNFVEFVSYQTLDVISTHPNFLSDKEFHRLIYDMMLAWEAPCIEFNPDLKESSSSESQEEDDEDSPSLFYSSPTNMAVQVDDAKTIGREAFARIAPGCVVIADIITVNNLFDALTSSSGQQLHFLIFDKYLNSLDRNIKATKLLPKSLTSSVQLADGETILDIDGTIPTQPVLQHIGISAWPGRLTLTNYAIYFESLGVGVYEKAERYDLAKDLKQVIKPELTGPLGARVFDKAVMYKSISSSDPVYFEFPEFKGNSRRDYWLDTCLEILHAHKFIRKFGLKEIQELDILARASLGILRYRTIREAFHYFSSQYMSLLAFILAESLPRGDKILQTLSIRQLTLYNDVSSSSSSTHHDSDGFSKSPTQKSSPAALLAFARLGFALNKGETYDIEKLVMGTLTVNDLCAGEINPLEVIVKQSMQDIRKAQAAQATVDKVKIEGIDTNIAVMKATERIALLLLFLAIIMMMVPLRHLILIVFLETFTREMPYRKESSDRWIRRLREWWIKVPAAPVQIVRIEIKKKR
ncbi:hypothetical protein LINPERHAP1_LOCUS2120 [Linum perenne]